MLFYLPACLYHLKRADAGGTEQYRFFPCGILSFRQLRRSLIYSRLNFYIYERLRDRVLMAIGSRIRRSDFFVISTIYSNSIL